MKNPILVKNLTVLLEQYGEIPLRAALEEAISRNTVTGYKDPTLTKDELVIATIKTMAIYGASKESIQQQLSKIPFEMSLEEIDKRMTEAFVEMEQQLGVPRT